MYSTLILAKNAILRFIKSLNQCNLLIYKLKSLRNGKCNNNNKNRVKTTK